MGQFDLKNATVKLVDGRQATLITTNGAGVNGRVTLTDVSRHRGTRPAVTIKITNAGVSHLSLDVAVVGTDIEVTPITDGSSIITSTAAQVEAAINAFPAAAALVTATLPGTGGSAVVAQAKTSLGTGPRSFSIKVAEGVIDYTEYKDRKYTLDRGKLGTVMNADEKPMDVKVDAIWENLTDGSVFTFEDALKQRNDCSDWTSTDPDQCQPYCVDLEVAYDPDCGVEREFITLQLFRYEQIGHQFKAGALSCSGKCNIQEADLLRVA